MKVISVGKPPEKLATCTYCDSELSYEPSDLVDSGNGVTHLLRCPVCGEYFSPGGEDTEDCGDVEYNKVPHYPEDLYSFENGAYIKEDKINEWIEEACERFDEAPMSELKNGFLYYTMCGDTMMFAMGCDNPDEPLSIYVCRGYSEGEYWSDRFHK